MAAKFTQEPFKIDMDGDIAIEVDGDDTCVASVHGMEGSFRGDKGPETDANRRLFLHSQALYRLAEMIVGGCTAQYVEREAKRLVNAIDGVKPKLEWEADGGRWSAPGKTTCWVISFDFCTGEFLIPGCTFSTLREAKTYCQEHEDKSHV